MAKATGILNVKVQGIPESEKDVTREKCTATYLITSSAKGRAILGKYAVNPFLSRTDKKAITQIVVDEFKDRFLKLTSSELEQRATELTKLFPSEPKGIWYHSPWETDSTGRRSS